jgi:hypothetical protein
LEEDPDGSPWSSWPLWQPMEGGGTGLNIRCSQAETMWSCIMDLARSANIIIYDPQSEELIIPGSFL